MSWRLARSLEVLRDEVNAAAPKRSKVSDGTIGDSAHSTRASDHNVNSAGVVRAMDLTHDPAGGLDCHELAARVIALGKANHRALGAGAYVIWRGRIASDTYGWTWRSYSGSNPHNHHCHISVATAAAGYDSTAPWTQEDDDMSPEQEARQKRIEDKLDSLHKKIDKFRDNEWKRDVREGQQLGRIEDQTKP